MGKLRVMSGAGDQSVVWDPTEVEAGDPEAVAAVREAERIFEEQLRRGGTAFQVTTDAPPRRLSRFDPEVEQIVVVPRMAGG